MGLVAVPLAVRAAGSYGLPGPQRAVSGSVLSFYNTHTHEKVTVSYDRRAMRAGGKALDDIARVMRDHRSGTAHPVSEGLVLLLADIEAELARRYPDQEITFHIVSGYRSPQTNEKLRATRGGQAQNSRHMHGDAMDIRVPGIRTTEIRDVAYCLGRGGVGYYKGNDFVHVDVWKVRTWNWTPAANMCGKATS